MTAATPLHKLPVKMLSDLVAARSLEKTLQDAALSRGLPPEDMGPTMLEEILKREVYKRLLLNVAPITAKKRIVDVLDEVAKLPADALRGPQTNPVSALEQASKRFTLYFDWPETQRLRGVLGIARTEGEAGRNIAPLIQEGQSLINQMERRLEEGLVIQAQELAELKAVFARVQPLGGKDVRRLESLVGQLEEAHGQNTLLPAEMERARNISFKLRKSLESSMMQADEVAGPQPDAQARVMALEQEHVVRKLTAIQRDYAPLLRTRPELARQHEEIRGRQSTGLLSETAVDAWREALETARQKTLAEQREELANLTARLGDTGESGLDDARVALDVARMTLQGGGLATEELRELRAVAQGLGQSPELAKRILEGQRELSELERSARDVAGATEALAASLTEARNRIEQGEVYDLSPLWTALERHMSKAAAQRQDTDSRADFVIAEYDEMRGLAGDTIQHLGRLAEALRAQRRLGPMSAEVRERYAQTLEDAEALLGEAHAEYEAAQRVTATFGEEALDDLLDVFDFGGDSLDELDPAANQGQSGGLFGVTESHWSSLSTSEPPARKLEKAELAFEQPTPPEPSTPTPRQSAGLDPFDTLLAAGHPAAPVVPTPTPAMVPTVPSFDLPELTPMAPAADAQRLPTLELPKGSRAEIWQVRRGELLAGRSNEAAVGMAQLLLQATKLGLQRLDMGDETHVWSARSVGGDEWRLARAPDWDSLDDDAGAWLDTGAL